jgi:predicted CopG family antitoxin
MLHFNKIFLPLILFFSLFSYAQYEIRVNFESGIEFKSQTDLINQIYNSGSKNDIEKLIKEEDWIEEYTLISKPFQKKIILNIRNKKPLFALNEKFFYDINLNKFKYERSNKDLIYVYGPITNLEDVIKIINNVTERFKVREIYYNPVSGWEVTSEETTIRFGKRLLDIKFKNFNDTLNYLLDIGRIPSIIDIRYKDGVAINYGSK